MRFRVGFLFLCSVLAVAGCSGSGGQRGDSDTLPMNLGLAVGSAEVQSTALVTASTSKTPATPTHASAVATALWLHYAQDNEAQPCADGNGHSAGPSVKFTSGTIPGSTAPAGLLYVTLCRGAALPGDVKNPNPGED